MVVHAFKGGFQVKRSLNDHLTIGANGGLWPISELSSATNGSKVTAENSRQECPSANVDVVTL
jgi:hypothetical protein